MFFLYSLLHIEHTFFAYKWLPSKIIYYIRTKKTTHLVYTRPYSQTYSIQVTYLYMRRYVVFVCPRHTVALNFSVRTNKKCIIQILNSR